MISLVDFNRRGQKQSKPGENKSNLRYEWTRLVLNKTSSLAEIKRPHRLLFEHLVTEAAKKSRKRTRPHTSITQPASCGCYHRDGAAPMSCKLCSRPSVSLQRTKETDKTFLYTTKHTRRQGLHFQSACSCSSREKTQGVCVCVCAGVYMWVCCLLRHWHIAADVRRFRQRPYLCRCKGQWRMRSKIWLKHGIFFTISLVFEKMTIFLNFRDIDEPYWCLLWNPCTASSVSHVWSILKEPAWKVLCK